MKTFSEEPASCSGCGYDAETFPYMTTNLNADRTAKGWCCPECGFFHLHITLTSGTVDTPVVLEKEGF